MHLGYSKEQIMGFSQALSGVHLARKFRREEDRPDDIKFGNFLDDIRLGFVMRGKVPSAEDLNKLYEADCRK